MTNLYHYATHEQWSVIDRDGRIETAESHVSLRLPDFGPRVVWLLDVADPTTWPYLPPDAGPSSASHDPDGTRETMVRIQVDVPAVRWLDWEWTDRMARSWRQSFIDARGGMHAADRWYVHPAPIPRTSWLSVLLTQPMSRPA